VERVADLEAKFFAALHGSLDELPIVGDVRGMGFLAGVELVADRSSRRPFPAASGMAARATSYALAEGLIVYACGGGVDGEQGDYLLLTPPYVISEAELDQVAVRLGTALARLSRTVF
jgi:adenosylmethionine-8-amino-7-oxononanoate aminotransferase